MCYFVVSAFQYWDQGLKPSAILSFSSVEYIPLRVIFRYISDTTAATIYSGQLEEPLVSLGKGGVAVP